jgi:hypothetical protein
MSFLTPAGGRRSDHGVPDHGRSDARKVGRGCAPVLRDFVALLVPAVASGRVAWGSSVSVFSW